MSIYNNKFLLSFILLFGFAVNSHATVLYGIETQNDNLFTIDTNTGITNTVGSLGVAWGFGGLAFSGSTLYGMNSNNSLYSIDSTTGLASIIGDSGAAGVFESFSIIGSFGYSQDVFSNDLYQINLATGAASLLGGYSDGSGRVTGLTTDGVNLYGTRIFSQDIVQLDIGTGAILNSLGNHGLSSDTNLAYADGQFYSMPAFDSALYSLDMAANATLLYSGLSGLPHVTGLTGPAASVPETSSIYLLGFGLLGLLGVVVRRKV